MPIHTAELKVQSERVENYSIYCFYVNYVTTKLW